MLPRLLSGKESTINVGDTGDAGSIPRFGRSPGEGNDNPLQHSCLEHFIVRGVWWTPLGHRVGHDSANEHSTHLTTILISS